MGEKKIEFISDKLGLRHRLKVFDVSSKQAYIYFLLRKKEVVYVGQTTNLTSRIRAHKKSKNFDGVTYFQTEVGENINILEVALIESIGPELNLTVKGRPLGISEIMALKACRGPSFLANKDVRYGRVAIIDGPWAGRYGGYDDDLTDFEEGDGFSEGETAAIVYLENEGGDYVLVAHEDIVNVPEAY